jgi:hypothetical protein
VGDTTVTCNADDPSGNLATPVTFIVHVVSASQQLASLSSSAQAVDGSFGGQVQAALASAASGKPGTATNQLHAFENHVQAQAGKELSTAQAADLLNAAQTIIAALGQ